MNDPRQGKPSASKIEMLYLCPGSDQAQAGLPPEEDNDVSESGTRIHAALAGEFPASKLDSQEMATFEDMSRAARTLAIKLGYDPEKFVSEQRLWFGDEFSAQIDRRYPNGVRLLLLDFKSGFLPVTDAPENPQLATEAVVALHNLAVAHVEVAIIPRFGAVTETAVYDLIGATKALEFIRQIISDSKKPDAPRRAGAKQCKYCAAKTRCPEYLAFNAVVMSTPKAVLPTMPAEQLGALIDRIPAVMDLVKALKAEGKRRVKDGDEEFRKLFEISKGRNLKTIQNLPQLFQLLHAQIGVTDAEFTAACSLDIGDVDDEGVGKGLKGLIHARAGLKGKALNDFTEGVLKGFVKEFTTEGSLKRIKEKK